MSEKNNPTCPRCQIGYLHPQTATYTAMFYGQLLSVPKMPAWVCDICQYEEFDDAAIAWMEALVGQMEAQHDAPRATAKLPPLDVDGVDVPKRTHRMKS